MIEPKSITIDGLEFNLQPLPALRAIKLDKRVVSLLLPALGGLQGFDPDAEVDFHSISAGLSRSLAEMAEDEFEQFICSLLSSVIFKPAGKPPQQITADLINTIFQGNILTLYKLAFEVMRFNKFSPFALLGDGNPIQKILSPPNQKQMKKGFGMKSEPSGSLLDN